MKTFALRVKGVALLWAALTLTARGQSPDPNLVPHQPLLSRVPDGSWTITYKYKAPPPETKGNGAKVASSPPLERTATIRVDKKGSSYHAVTTETSGKRAEHWSVGGIEIYRDVGSDSFVKLAKNSSFYIDFSKTDFDELSWAGMDNYKGVEKGAEGAKFFVFDAKNSERRQTAQEHANSGDLGEMVEKLGMVDSKNDQKQAIAKMMEREYGSSTSHVTVDVLTQLPDEYDNGKVVRTYSYTAEPLAVPPELTKFFTNMEKQKRKETVPVPPP